MAQHTAIIPWTRSNAGYWTTTLNFLMQNVENRPAVGCFTLCDEESTSSRSTVDDYSGGVPKL
ncbi:hypothetical protein ColTof4_02682 [Colletotrichum tofieldiae]|nr:hypothetical protein ColTof3_09026 [Colletotrichum tofieldiae]GKT70259.1 hypothetical protein ColTof4_02682 [Colletotrichum tofieldiae]GKT93312.1 hypothetical protein Ct61P_11162 [Colletotrichum tofieldiae]